MKKPLFRTAIAFAATLVMSPAIQAQSASATLSAPIQRSGYISLSANAISFPTPTAADFKAGYTQPVSVGLRFGGNATIDLTYNFDASTLTGDNGGSIPVSDIMQTYDGSAGEFMTQYGTAWRQGIAPGDYAETLTYKLRVGWSTAPQNYTGNLTYTISVL